MMSQAATMGATNAEDYAAGKTLIEYRENVPGVVSCKVHPLLSVPCPT